MNNKSFINSVYSCFAITRKICHFQATLEESRCRNAGEVVRVCESWGTLTNLKRIAG